MPASSPDFDIQKSAYRWILISLAATVYAMSFVTRFSWPPLIPEIMPAMGINHTEAMAYMTAFFLGYTLTQLPSGLLADRVGPRRVMFVSLSLQGLTLLGLGFTESYLVGLGLRTLCGLGAGCLFSSCIKSLVTWFAPAQRGLALGLFYISLPMGIAAANLSMPLLSRVFGWQGAFRTVGLVLIGLAALLICAMKEVKAVETGVRAKVLVNLRLVFQNRNIILAAAASTTIVWSQVGFASVASAYLTDILNFTVVEAGRVVMVFGLIGILAPLLAGPLCDRFPLRKKALVIGGHLALVADILAFGQTGDLVLVYLTAGLFGFLIFFVVPIYMVVIAENTSLEWAATATGLSNTIMQAGALTVPLAVGLAIDLRGDYDLTWLLLAAGPLAGVIFAALIVNPPKEG